MVSEKIVEAREFAHEVVKAAAGGRELTQSEPGERARRHRPQQQCEMGEITALAEDPDQVCHGRVPPLPLMPQKRLSHGEFAPIRTGFGNSLISRIPRRRNLLLLRGAQALGDACSDANSSPNSSPLPARWPPGRRWRARNNRQSRWLVSSTPRSPITTSNSQPNSAAA